MSTGDAAGRRVLVVGGTGALRPAAHALAEGGATVYALARTAASLRAPRIVPVEVDFLDVAALAGALADVPRCDAALLYCPTAPDAARAVLAAHVVGTVVELLTSGHAVPDGPDDAVDPDRLPSVGVPLLLGWTADTRRWHSPEELSTAALDVLRTGRPAVLGTVRPWSDRPT